MSRKLAGLFSAIAIALLTATLLYVALPRQEIRLSILQLLLGQVFIVLVSALALIPTGWLEGLKKKHH